MADCNDILDILKRDGTGQEQRYTDALRPDYFRLQDLDIADWMLFASKFAEHVNYFGSDNKVSGNWQHFFAYFGTDQEEVDTAMPAKFSKAKEEIIKGLHAFENEHTLTPHLTLFVCFLKLLELSKKRFNKLTKRHLDFYYGEVLKIDKLPPTPDKVYVLFELAKNISEEKIPEATELDGGKDNTGKKRIYTTTEELIANRAAIARLKNVYRDNNTIKCSEKADSYDGQGADFPEGKAQWYPFGHSYKGEEAVSAGLPELQDATLGFALASPALELAEGERTVRMEITFPESLPPVSGDELNTGIDLYFSGEKEWLGPFRPGDSTSGTSGKNLVIAVTLDKDIPAITAYDQKILLENFRTTLPIVKALCRTGTTNGYGIYQKLAGKNITGISIGVEVNGIRKLRIENDHGALNPEKPFYPFTTRPVKGSAFTLNYPEAFRKNWTGIDVNIPWKNTPDDFRELYYAYRPENKYQSSQFNYLEGLYHALEITADSNHKTNKAFAYNSIKEDNLIVKDNDHFKASVTISDKEEWQEANIADGHKITLFQGEAGEFETGFTVTNPSPPYTPGKNGPLRLSMENSFLHEMFPRIYAIALASEDDNVLVPNEPYTPFADSISMNYTASAGNGDITLFHIHPFGQCEAREKETLMPTYCNRAGELYIGMENLEPGQQLSLLFQVLEGSENPEKESFLGKQKIEWSVLGNDQWLSMDETHIIKNETDNLLRSGIVRFSIPKEATDSNTRLPEGFFWLRARSYKEFDVVCKVIGIHSQAVKAVFENRGNELSHLNNGLEAGSISKLTERISSIKSAAQPYTSFKGIPPENDRDYYRRTSERLRHKNRAQASWDYEHMLLQQFPGIYKIKCLNHTRYCSKKDQMYYQSPGHVTLVTIPDVVNKNVFDIYQPRVSTTFLNEMENYINLYNSMHIRARVINPLYEQVKVDLKVKFHPGRDENFYKKQLNKDITRLLSPWAFDRSEGIEFGLSLRQSVLVHYMEKLDYVDYLQDVRLFKDGEIQKNIVSPSGPAAILVSARTHTINTDDIKTCANTIIEKQETCQP
ncbi:baseplate J/gp47 family protein [Sinomicrobium sp. M5D2P9]